MKLKYLMLSFLFLSISLVSYGQNRNEYSKLIQEGWKLCIKKDFVSSAKLYEKAFKINKNVPLSDRYNASCIYALSNNKEDAFKHLFIIGNELKWDDVNHLKNDADLISLHKDKRWEKLVFLIEKNKKEKEKHFDKGLVSILNKIYFDDQNLRSQLVAKEKKYGRDSKEMKTFWQTILKKDSLNLIKVSEILNDRGWPDKKMIGARGTSTLFLVIQHADKNTQEKYLPMIEKAVFEGNLPKRQFAMFYDRLVLRRGERQKYGTQLAMNNVSKKPYVLPLLDPVNVDSRRLKMGLNTMQENLNRWNLVWDVNQYLKDLPAIEAKERELDKKNKN